MPQGAAALPCRRRRCLLGVPIEPSATLPLVEVSNEESNEGVCKCADDRVIDERRQMRDAAEDRTRDAQEGKGIKTPPIQEAGLCKLCTADRGNQHVQYQRSGSNDVRRGAGKSHDGDIAGRSSLADGRVCGRDKGQRHAKENLFSGPVHRSPPSCAAYARLKKKAAAWSDGAKFTRSQPEGADYDERISLSALWACSRLSGGCGPGRRVLLSYLGVASVHFPRNTLNPPAPILEKC
jgi:hypothetical protein